MSAISLKSITGITSITTPAGVDNQLTLHNNNTTEAVKLDTAGNVHINNHLAITGVTTMTGNLTVSNTAPAIFFTDTNNDNDFRLILEGGLFRIQDVTAGNVSRFRINSSGLAIFSNNVNIDGDLDVDGHTNLDNVSIAGVSTFTGRIDASDNIAITSGNRLYFGNSDVAFIKGEHGGSGYLSFGANNEHMRLTRDGNLSLGSGAASFASIGGNTAGGLEIHKLGNDTAACLKLTGNNNTGTPGQETYTQLEHRGANLTFNINHNGTERFRITSSGAFGFNTSITRENIHTHQADSNQNYLRFTNTGTGTGSSDGFNIGITASEEPIVWNFENTNMLFATNNTERLRITSDGKVVINKTSGDFDGALHVNAISENAITIEGSNAAINWRYTNGSAGYRGGIKWHSSGLVKFDAGVSGNSYYYAFHLNAAERLRITSDGKVGINATNPNSLLEVRATAGTYTNAVTVFTGNTTHSGSNSKNGIGLYSYGDALRGGLSSNLLYSNSSTPSQTYASRSSGQIEITNTTLGSKTSTITFGGYYKGTTTFVERLRINSDGYITKPYQVAFFAHCTIGDHDLNTGDKFQFNSLTSASKSGVNSNHHTFGGTAVFNASTNTFTAPVAGLYHFTVTAYFRRTGDPLTLIVARVNNTEVSNGNDTVFFFGSNDITDGLTLSGSLTLQLAANDAVTVHRRTGQSGTTRFYGPHSHFCGHLIG